MAWIRDFWALAKKVDGLLELEKKHGEAIADLKVALDGIEKRVARLEHREDIVASEARSAARAGAADVMGGQMMEIGRRLALLEAGALQIDDPKPKRSRPKKLPSGG